MGGKFENMSLVTTEELYIKTVNNENSLNGYVFNDEHYIPEELLLNILCHVDYKTLCSCQLVCKQWNFLMKTYVWHKKAELILNHTLPLDKNIPWTSYYFICHKKPFNRNLIKNQSGEKSFILGSNKTKHGISKCVVRDCSKQPHFVIRRNSDSDWTIMNAGGDGWAVESPPCGVQPLPDNLMLDYCFVTSYGRCWKEQDIDLVKEGISEYILDNWQPTIKVSEWFSSRFDCGSIYMCTTNLCTEENVILSHFNYHKVMKDEEQNQWFKYEHEFKNYGKGLRKINFCHGGQDKRGWAGHYGSKMSGACIKLQVPDSIPKIIDPQHIPFHQHHSIYSND